MNDEEIILSLTSKDSHKIINKAGVGSFSIGTKDISNGEFDVLVEKGSVINWDAFNGLYVPATLEQENKPPYGDWPRWFYYSGNDIGFIDWSSKREIEGFYWYPQKDMIVDFTKSNIYNLEIQAINNIQLLLGSNIYYLGLYGTLEKYKIIRCDKVPLLKFWPEYEKNIDSYKLPVYELFSEAKEVQIAVDPSNPPFDCKSLLQFSRLESLYLIGNMTNLEELKKLKNLKKIGLWDMRNLSNFPNLSDWNNLNSFKAANIEETVGKRLRKEAKELKTSGKLKEYIISALKSEAWFETNCGIPFSYWEGKNGKKALTIYKKCLKKVNESKTEAEIKNAIIEYTEKFNNLDDIETIEREDIYSALCKIMNNSPVEINNEKWVLWFDEKRNF